MLRWVFGILGSLVALVAIAIVGVIALFDPNDYKQFAVDQAAKAGYEVTLEGDLSLAFFPTLRIELPATQVNALTGPTQSVSVESAQVAVEVLPLVFDRQVVAETVVLVSPQVRVDLDAFASQGAAAEPQSTGANPLALAIGGLDLQTGRIEILQGGQLLHDLTIDRLQVGAVAPDSPVDVSFVGGYAAPGLPDVPMQVTTTARIDSSFSQLGLGDLNAEIAGLSLSGDLNLDLTAPSVAGGLSLAPFDARALASQFGVELAPMNKADALTSVGFDAVFDGSGVAMTETLSIALDGVTFTGSGGLQSLEPLRFDLTLNGDRLVLDDYLNATTSETATAETQTETVNPFAALAGIQGRLALGLDALEASGLKFQRLQTVANIDDRRIVLEPLAAQGYEGALQGQAVVNGRGTTPSMSADLALTGLQVNGLLTDLADFDSLSGVATFKTQVLTEGLDADSIMSNLNGTATGELVNGALKGIAVDSLICDGLATVMGSESKLAAGDTAFDAMRFDTLITNGVADFETLRLGLVQLSVDGRGQINLPAQAMNLRFDASLTGDDAIKGCAVPSALASATLPLKCEGGFSDAPTSLCGFDSSRSSGLLEQLGVANLKAEGEARVEEIKTQARVQVEEKKDELEAELKEKAADKLKSLFR